MNACEKLTAWVYQNRDSLRISRDDFRAYLETAVSDSAQPDLLGALKALTRDCMASDFNEHWGSFQSAEAAIAKAEGRAS
jgi:hypothetical protein